MNESLNCFKSVLTLSQLRVKQREQLLEDNEN